MRMSAPITVLFLIAYASLTFNGKALHTPHVRPKEGGRGPLIRFSELELMPGAERWVNEAAHVRSLCWRLRVP